MGTGQSAAGYDIKPQAAMEMLATCDGRLQALMAEANLLGEAASSQGQDSAPDAELSQAFASLLIESGKPPHKLLCWMHADSKKTASRLRSTIDTVLPLKH